ncbi:MAG: hypothetical protein IIA87_02745 [Nanoarchaeota archaeon]|nr:hypothetical protein [Nanoarchaeota archaeon]
MRKSNKGSIVTTLASLVAGAITVSSMASCCNYDAVRQEAFREGRNADRYEFDPRIYIPFIPYYNKK